MKIGSFATDPQAATIDKTAKRRSLASGFLRPIIQDLDHETG